VVASVELVLKGTPRTCAAPPVARL
jgi:hypothetical protein